jgi:hypothetical protein
VAKEAGKAVVEAPSNPSIPYPDVYNEIKGGIWAVGLTVVVLWVATRSIREAVVAALRDVVKAYILTMNDLKETSEKTLDEVEEINKVVKELADKWD